MGLDNGITLRTRNSEQVLSARREYTTIEPYESEFNNDGWVNFEICYWRKCWGLRNRILAAISNTKEEEYEYDLTIKDLKEIRKVIFNILCEPDEWEEDGGSIWEFNDMIPHLARNIVNISWLIEFMEEHPNCNVQFYDSY